MSQPYLVRFGQGLPTYVVHGQYSWRPESRPVTLLFNDWDLFWVQQGQATWELKDGKKLVAGADEFAVLPPFVSGMISESRAPLVFWYCHFSFRLPTGEYRPEARSDIFGPGADALVPLTFARNEAPAVWQAYAALSRLEVGQAASPWRLERALLELVAALADLAQSRAAGAGKGLLITPECSLDPRVARICAQIDAAPAQRWRVRQLAESVGLSPGRLHSLCRRVLRNSLKGYIVQARLQKALTLLNQGRSGARPSVKEVSVACGFSSQHFFSRQFKTHYRLSPIQYRNAAHWEISA